MRSIADTAKAWNVPNATLRYWIRIGVVKTVRLGANATMILDSEKPKAPKRGAPKRAAEKSTA